MRISGSESSSVIHTADADNFLNNCATKLPGTTRYADIAEPFALSTLYEDCFYF